MPNEQELEEKYEGSIPDALIFAFNAHSGQYRKANPEQYIIHPIRVSEFLLKNFPKHPHLEDMRVAAILHDTIEDTWTTHNDIELKFGHKIAQLVSTLTKPEIEDKHERLEKYIIMLKEGSDDAKIIKLADIFDNVLSTDDTLKWKEFTIKSEKMLKSLELNEKNEHFEKLKEELLNTINNRLDKYE